MRASCLLVLLLSLAGCAGLAPEAPPPVPPTLAGVDSLARGRIGQVVMLDGETLVGVHFQSIRADSIVGIQGAEPLAVATDGVRQILLIGGESPDSRPLLIAGLCAAPYVVAGLEAAILPGDGNGCLNEPNSSPVEFFAGGACIGALAFAVSRETLPAYPRRDLVIPIAPLSRFADAPRAGVGLWRRTD